MSLMKIALTVLGTVGLTAGTVLAVAEPTPSSLPEAAANASACTGCPTKACGTAKCMSAVSACSKAAPACAKSCDAKSACTAESANSIGGPVDPSDAKLVSATACEAKPACVATESCSTGSACSATSACSASACSASACSATACESETACRTAKKTKKVTLSLGFGSNGPIIRLASGEEPAPCAEGACDGLAECVKKAVAACACPAGSCEKENCSACPCEGKCEQTEQVAATACEAKPACAASACAASACAASACNSSTAHASTCDTTACEAGTCAVAACAVEPCNASKCPSQSESRQEGEESCQEGETVAADDDFSDSAVAACDCKDCCCESCDCTTDTACPPGEICPVAARLHRFQTAGILPNGIRLITTHIAPRTEEAASRSEGCRNGGSCRTADVEQPGRVRLTSPPAWQFFLSGLEIPGAPVRFPAQPTPMFPSMALLPAMACGAEFESPKTWPALRAASYAESGGEAPEPTHRSVEGTWTRDVDGTKITFTIERDRLRGSVAGMVRFSGTCSVSRDGQIFGLLDEIRMEEIKSMAAGAAATRLVDQPFAFRFATDGEDLIVKDFRCGGMDGVIGTDGAEIKLVDYVSVIACGRFERSE